jgi:type I restriction enzyme M protein
VNGAIKSIRGIRVGRESPLTLDKFEEFFRLLPGRADSEHSWMVTRQEIEAKNFDLKAVNPHAKNNEDTRTPEELLDLIEAKGREVAEALAVLRDPARTRDGSPEGAKVSIRINQRS